MNLLNCKATKDKLDIEIATKQIPLILEQLKYYKKYIWAPVFVSYPFCNNTRYYTLYIFNQMKSINKRIKELQESV